MSTEGMRAENSELIDTEREVEAVATNLTLMLNGLMNRLEVLDIDWVGLGGTSFSSVKVTYNENMAKLNLALRTLGEAVGSSGRSYELTDQEIQAEMGKLMGGGATQEQIDLAQDSEQSREFESGIARALSGDDR